MEVPVPGWVWTVLSKSEPPKRGQKNGAARNLSKSVEKLFAPANLQKCVGGFLLYEYWRIFSGIFLEDFSGHFSHKNEEKKSGEKIREKIRRPKNYEK